MYFSVVNGVKLLIVLNDSEYEILRRKMLTANASFVSEKLYLLKMCVPKSNAHLETLGWQLNDMV